MLHMREGKGHNTYIVTIQCAHPSHHHNSFAASCRLWIASGGVHANYVLEPTEYSTSSNNLNMLTKILLSIYIYIGASKRDLRTSFDLWLFSRGFIWSFWNCEDYKLNMTSNMFLKMVISQLDSDPTATLKNKDLTINAA